MALFDRAIAFTDLHLGKKNNSHTFNRDCLDFVSWVCDQAKKTGIKTGVFLGDWHDNRASINVATLNYSLQCLDMLDQTFDVVYWIPGNHDEYYKDRRDMNSIAFVEKFKNVHFFNEITTIDGATFVPWLIGDESKQMKKLSSDMVFGHFELPHFFMNSKIQMPEHGEIKREDFSGCGLVLSGHFHKRQTGNNITYIGNAFPHNYNDVGDDERGISILGWGEIEQYIKWPDAPAYRRVTLSSILDNPDRYLKPKTYTQIVLDLDISYEEANFIRETFLTQYNLRELALLPSREVDEATYDFTGEITFESVDTIVTNQLNQIDSDVYNRNLLLDIYRNI